MTKENEPLKVAMFGLRLPEIEPGDDVVKLMMEASLREANGLEDGDIVVVTSKIVSKAYNSLIRLDEVKPSKEALKIAEKIGEDPRFVQAVLENSDEVLFVFPFLKLVEKGLISIEKVSKNLTRTYQAIKKFPATLIVRRDGQIYSDAGLDSSNHPHGVVSIPPKNLDKFAKEIRDKILELTGKEVAVIITDTEMYFSFGSLDFARGSSGIEVASKRFGEPDLYGKPKFGGVDRIADEIACASALLMGQTDAGVPVVIIRGYKYVKSEEGISDYQLKPETIRIIVREMLKESVRVLGLKWLLRRLIKLFKSELSRAY